jgi:general secretion pathway protein D
VTRSGIPGITEIRFLNDLLASHETVVTRTELIIFIKPQIIGNPEDAQHVSEEFRDRMQVIESGARPSRSHW